MDLGLRAMSVGAEVLEGLFYTAVGCLILALPITLILMVDATFGTISDDRERHRCETRLDSIYGHRASDPDLYRGLYENSAERCGEYWPKWVAPRN